MKTTIAAIIVFGTCAFNVVHAQEIRPLTGDELKSRIAGISAVQTESNGLVYRWTNQPDGSTVVTRYADSRFSKSHNRTAEGEWTISEAGEYCLTVHWDTSQGGAAMGRDKHWCAPVYAMPDGTLSATPPNAEPVTFK